MISEPIQNKSVLLKLTVGELNTIVVALCVMAQQEGVNSELLLNISKKVKEVSYDKIEKEIKKRYGESH